MEQAESFGATASKKDTSQIVLELERELRAGKRKRWLRLAVVVGGLTALVVGYGFYQKTHAPPPVPRFVTAGLEVRDIIEEVQSTGVVEPVNKVEIGSQVSGRVVKVYVDFNDLVTKGQVLAEIDPEILGAEVVQSQAQLAAARAQKARAEATTRAIELRLARQTQMRAENLATASEFEQTEGELEVARAEVKSADAQIAQLSARVNSAQTTLGYTKIHSPIDGVVIDRKIEPGQTVAASFNTPLLFMIAEDLKQMRVLAEIDESDVGKVKEGMPASIVVDAFPDDSFQGVLKQIRLSPNSVEGVVTYAAVILVDNVGGKLRPGMTATSTIVSRSQKQVLAVRNAALRFEPTPEKKAGPPGAAPAVPETKPVEKRSVEKLGPGERRVYFAGSGPAENPGSSPKVVKIGVTDGVWTEVLGGLEPTSKVIVEERVSEEKRGFRLF